MDARSTELLELGSTAAEVKQNVRNGPEGVPHPPIFIEMGVQVAAVALPSFKSEI